MEKHAGCKTVMMRPMMMAKKEISEKKLIADGYSN
jgi:hypothetical protein